MLLLDTCSLLWLTADPSRLSNTARKLIREHADGLFISAISAFEIALKHAKGRLALPAPPSDWMSAVMAHHRLAELPVSCQIALMAAALPPFHNDPFDRIIIATAQVQRTAILTPDELIRSYPEAQVLW